jgi:UDP-galactopyranose mutase
MVKNLILGGGLAGLSAAYHLSEDYEIIEKQGRVGGLCRSEALDGFLFDYAIHILYSSDPYATRLIQEVLLKDNFHSQPRSSWVCSNGVHTFYPFQANTYGLPVDVVKECILGLIRATYEADKDREPVNFEDWVYATFGEGIAKHFMIPFNRKCWAVDLKQMSSEWVRDRVLQPKLEEVIHGALTDQRKGFGPNAEFWYPKEGGIEALPRGFLPHLDESRIHLQTEVVAIEVAKKQIETARGEKIAYRHLVSTLPLPRLVDLIPHVPGQVAEARKRLEHNTIWAVNLCIDRARISDRHWIYYPEMAYLFHRISFPMNFHPSMAPEGKSSITVEVGASKYKHVNRDTLVEDVIRDLKKTDYLKDEGEILAHNVLELTPAYIIYHIGHRRDVEFIHAYLRSIDIWPCGRFGDWEYLNMDHSILCGKRVAEQLQKGSA